MCPSEVGHVGWKVREVELLPCMDRQDSRPHLADSGAPSLFSILAFTLEMLQHLDDTWPDYSSWMVFGLQMALWKLSTVAVYQPRGKEYLSPSFKWRSLPSPIISGNLHFRARSSTQQSQVH